MAHPLITQLRFTRDEFVRGLTGLTDEEARRRFEPINSISWMIGHRRRSRRCGRPGGP
jgi:hypothetical protein